MAADVEIRVGQIWESLDPRDNGRRVVVIEAPASLAANASVVVRSVRKSTMRVRTIQTRYRLCADA